MGQFEQDCDPMNAFYRIYLSPAAKIYREDKPIYCWGIHYATHSYLRIIYLNFYIYEKPMHSRKLMNKACKSLHLAYIILLSPAIYGKISLWMLTFEESIFPLFGISMNAYDNLKWNTIKASPKRR